MPIVRPGRRLAVQWHRYRHLLGRFRDLVFSDAQGAMLLQQTADERSAAGCGCWWRGRHKRAKRRLPEQWPEMVSGSNGDDLTYQGVLRSAGKIQQARKMVGRASVGGDHMPGSVADAGLRQELARAIQERPRDADLLNAYGAIAAASASEAGPRMQAAQAFQDAWCADPRHVVADSTSRKPSWPWDSVPMPSGQGPAHPRCARRSVRSRRLFSPRRSSLAGMTCCAANRERAAWANAGQPQAEAAAKGVLLRRWRLRLLLGE